MGYKQTFKTSMKIAAILVLFTLIWPDQITTKKATSSPPSPPILFGATSSPPSLPSLFEVLWKQEKSNEVAWKRMELLICLLEKKRVEEHVGVEDNYKRSKIVKLLVNTRPSRSHGFVTNDMDMDAMEKAYESMDKMISEYCNDLYELGMDY